MLNNGNYKAGFFRSLLLMMLVLISMGARSQDAVYLLKGVAERSGRTTVAAERGSAQSFEFHRNLIFFPAKLDGEVGNFILDTGAPTLLINSRQKDPQSSATGYGTGGEVQLAHYKIESLEFGGQHLNKRWALALDLRAMEQRTGRRIDGFVGYDVLTRRELRIDYLRREFSLLKSSRKPVHAGVAPDHVLDLNFVDHLPVVKLKAGKQKLRFILDTGASVNLIDHRYAALTVPLGRKMNIQGLDGNNASHDIIELREVKTLSLTAQQRAFVSMNLDHLQAAGEPQIAGILGSTFLDNYVVGIDYRRRKLYLWQAQ